MIVHMSAAPAIAELAKFRAEGVKAYGETMPHFLCLDEAMYQKPGMEPLKVVITPPLRPKEHQALLWAGLRSGILSTVGSDHCAFPYKDKIRLYETRGSKFTMIPHGAPGIENSHSGALFRRSRQGRLSLNEFVQVTAQTRPGLLDFILARELLQSAPMLILSSLIQKKV